MMYWLRTIINGVAAGIIGSLAAQDLFSWRWLGVVISINVLTAIHWPEESWTR